MAPPSKLKDDAEIAEAVLSTDRELVSRVPVIALRTRLGSESRYSKSTESELVEAVLILNSAGVQVNNPIGATSGADLLAGFNRVPIEPNISLSRPNAESTVIESFPITQSRLRTDSSAVQGNQNQVRKPSTSETDTGAKEKRHNEKSKSANLSQETFSTEQLFELFKQMLSRQDATEDRIARAIESMAITQNQSLLSLSANKTNRLIAPPNLKIIIR